MYNKFGISDKAKELVLKSEESLTEEFKKIDDMCDINSLKVLRAFNNNKISEVHFNTTTGYGYDDVGRDAIEKVFAETLGAEDALVRSQFISGSHALCVALFAYLRPGDTMLSITGTPYDTLHEVIGIKENKSSLKAFGVNYDEIDLVDNDFDYEKIKECITNNKIKLIEIQRSKGYSTRKSITIDKVEKVVSFIKNIDKDVIIMVDNCYCEFVEDKTPTEVGADVMVGSLIKNLGGGIAPNGAYIAGKKELVDLAGERLTLPGEGREVGPTLGINKQILQGLFLAPSVVASALKTAVLTSKVLEDLGYDVEPKYNDVRADIVQNIIFKNENDLVEYCGGIQSASPIDSFSKPLPWDMPGYDDKVVMAAGAFTQGSSIELSCDGPIREPFIAYQQGSLTYSYGKIAVMKAVTKLIENK
ncbi:MAG: aminotransferase class I/II-fold pyridoxal phosphate-dependent enzyme [Candidatus Aphodocola sp.]